MYYEKNTLIKVKKYFLIIKAFGYYPKAFFS